MIYIDLDGVLFNFDKRAEEILGKPFKQGDNQIWEELQKHPNFFSQLELMPDAMELWNHIKHLKPIVLTAIPRIRTFPLAEQHKREAVAKHFGDHVEVRIGPFARDKQYHCKSPGEILIDDNPINICQWSNRGGVGIYHQNTEVTIKCLKELGIHSKE